MENREKFAEGGLLEETVTYTVSGEALKGEWQIHGIKGAMRLANMIMSEFLETVENAKKEEDPLIGKYIKTEDGTVGKVVYRHTEYQTGYTVYTGGEKVYQFYREEYVQENLLEEEIQELISDKSIGEDVVDAVFGLILDEMYDMLQEFAQDNDMEFPSDEKDELSGRHILFDDCTIGRIVGTTQTATYNKAYKICDSLEPLNIQVRDEDFVKGGLIDESLEKYMKDEHLGRDFTGVMFQEMSDAIRERWF